jgi:PAS domain-containing protein
MVDHLNEDEFPFQELVTNTCVICFVLDCDSKLLQANQMFYQSLGYKEDYFEKNKLKDLFTDKRAWSNVVKVLQNDGDQLTTTLKIFAKGGKPYFITCNIGYKRDKVYVVGIDVTDDTQQNVTLEKVAELSRTGGWTYNPSEKKMHWTDCLYEILEISEKRNMTRELFLEFIHPDSLGLFNKSSKELYDEHQPYNIQIRLMTSKHKVIWVRIISDPEVFNGEVAFVHGVMQDITKFKDQSIALEETKINMELALRAMNSGYFTHDLINNDLEYNGSFIGKVDIPDDLTQEQFFQHVHPEDREEAFKQHQRELDTQDVYYINAYRMKSLNGKYKHFEVHGFKVFNSQNKPVKLVGNLIDVDDKYRLNQLQDKHKYYMKTLLDNTFVRSIMLDKELTMIGLDGMTADLFTKRLGFNPVLKKSNFKDILSSHDRLKFNIIERVLDKGQEYRNKVHLDIFEEDRTYYDALFKPILDYSNEIDGYVFYFFDLTDEPQL